MSALPWILGGVAAGGLVLLVRAKRQQQAAQPTASQDPCASLSGDEKTVCQAAGAALPLVGEAINALGDYLFQTQADVDKADAKNIELNGGVDVPIADLTGKVGNDLVTTGAWYEAHGVGSAPDPGSGGFIERRLGTMARAKNGCVPFAGAPGYEKCVAGTTAIGGNEDVSHVYTMKPYDLRDQAHPGATMTGGPGDFMTGGVSGRSTFIDRGKLVTCDRGGAAASPDKSHLLCCPTSANGICTTSGPATSVDPNDPNFCWVNGAYVRRRANGQCPAPSSPAPSSPANQWTLIDMPALNPV